MKSENPGRAVLAGLGFLALTLCLGIFSLRAAGKIDFSRLVSARPQAAPLNWTADDREWSQMASQLEKLAVKFPGRMGIFLKDLKTGREWAYHADELFPSASLVKVPIMASVFTKFRTNELDLDEQLVLRRDEKRGGSGTLRRLRSGTRVSVRRLLEKMITESDNTAANMLINRVGMNYLQNNFAKLGLNRTGIHPEGMSLSSFPVLRENYTTPREMASLVEEIYRGDIVDKASSEMMIELMKRVKNHSRFARRLPAGWELAHKTGMLRQSCHDVGVFFSPQGDYLLAVMTWKVPDYRYAGNYITKVASVTFRYYGVPLRQYAQARANAAKTI